LLLTLYAIIILGQGYNRKPLSDITRHAIDGVKVANTSQL
jgi:hypothetical protein